MRQALLIIGIIAALTGLVWIGQGTGYFPYPREELHGAGDAMGLVWLGGAACRPGRDLVLAPALEFSGWRCLPSACRRPP